MTPSPSPSPSTINSIRELPRRLRWVVEARDAIASEAGYCQQAQSWAPGSTRSGWWHEVRAVVQAVDALVEALDNEDGADQALVDALDTAVDAADEEAVRLARKVARNERDQGVYDLGAAATAADDAEDLANELAKFESPYDEGDRGWRVEYLDDGRVKVTGWSQTRVVCDEHGEIVLGSDWSDLEEVSAVARLTPGRGWTADD
jgi:hypothetical protein